ncbi:MAG: class I SAM-dependent methyltransferase [Bacteroidia bacterium]|nr:class I SAM-dependent methyltransferase [Bacteroidia bacterium]
MTSSKHTNTKLHNWLIYRISDTYLQERINYFNGRLYDLGCGEMPYKDFFLNHADQYIGVDWSDTFHKANPDIAADLNKVLPIDSEVADTVVSLSVLEHLNEPQMMLNEAHRILKPGGAIVLQVPFQWHIHESPYDYFRYTPYGLKYLFEKAGFKHVIIEPTGGFFTMLTMKINYFSTRLIPRSKAIRWIITALLIPPWVLAQLSAFYLDKLDRNWSAETCGYFVTATKE